MINGLSLVTGLERDRKRFAKMRQTVRREMRHAKNNWFQKKADEAEKSKILVRLYSSVSVTFNEEEMVGFP